ncbi:MAG TPA: hypothetical protein VFO63_08120, partial [Blastocatellia bacterium]|nr:hypothetical protein [Blastocatellia bacterium]
MAKRLHPNSITGLPLQPAELVEDEALSRGKVEAAESNGASQNGSSASGHVSPLDATEAIETFFELAMKELAAMRTRAEVEAIERAAELIIECESRGG